MLFSSKEFILYFLPAVWISYIVISQFSGRRYAKIFIALASIVFYAWWKLEYLPILLISVVVNFFLSKYLLKNNYAYRKSILTAGIIFNLGLLGYFKYTYFIIDQLNIHTGTSFSFEPILLPLAISFFTFQQLAYLVDAYKNKVQPSVFFDYLLFVSFFPQLIAGPIVHHQEMMPQFEANNKQLPSWENLRQGVQIFIIGLFKKIVIADTLAIFADQGWAAPGQLTFFDAWGTTLCYTFQLYFDFSGYSDMAIGAALLFGIRLPLNFNSPYKALNIQDFWRRWHMTLSRWLRDYIYIPLGGSRVKEPKILLNLVITFLLGGIWHGAGWTFILWGLIHGLGTIIHRLWSRLKIPLPKWSAWLLTFVFIHFAWVFFRATSLEEAYHVAQAMIGINGVRIPQLYTEFINSILNYHLLGPDVPAWSGVIPSRVIFYLGFAAIIAFIPKNSGEITFEKPLRFPIIAALTSAAMILICILTSIDAEKSPFLYFNF